MRRVLLCLASATLLASACNSSAMPAASSFQGVDPGHHQPTPAPVRPAASAGAGLAWPAATATPYGGVTWTSDLARTFGAASPYFRFDAIVATTAELVRGSELASARWTIRDVADVANREAELLPANDEVHAFLDRLSNLGRLRN